jgi:putative nucleotidyltransferase with HDIG domain
LDLGADFAASLEELAEILVLKPKEEPPGEAQQVEILSEKVLEHYRKTRPAPAAFPAVALRVIDLMEARHLQISQLVSVIGQDAAISATVLKLANSTLYFRGTKVQNVRTAVTHIGFANVAQIAAGVAGRSLYDVRATSEFALYKERWHHLFHRSMTVAFTAGWLAMTRKAGGADRAFSGGMFHDIGKTMALRSLSGLVMAGRLRFNPTPGAVDRMLEKVHVELGVEMHKAWSLPDYLVTICQHHHDADLPDGPELADVHVVRLVSGLNDLRIHPDYDSPMAEEIRKSCRALELDRTLFLKLNAELRGFAERVTTMFGVADEVNNL